VYAESLELFSRIISLATALAKLAGTLVADGIRYIALLARSRSAIGAENLFRRKQLALFVRSEILHYWRPKKAVKATDQTAH